MRIQALFLVPCFQTDIKPFQEFGQQVPCKILLQELPILKGKLTVNLKPLNLEIFVTYGVFLTYKRN